MLCMRTIRTILLYLYQRGKAVIVSEYISLSFLLHRLVKHVTKFFVKKAGRDDTFHVHFYQPCMSRTLSYVEVDNNSGGMNHRWNCKQPVTRSDIE